MRDDDVLVITADHGCDPTWQGTDHTREHIPVLVYGNSVSPGALGKRESFARQLMTQVSTSRYTLPAATRQPTLVSLRVMQSSGSGEPSRCTSTSTPGAAPTQRSKT